MPHIPKKPINDREFFEIMSQIIFISGFRWDIVMKRWPNIKKAFCNFDVKKVRKLKLEKVLGKKDMIKNKPKINAIITNASLCLELIKDHGSLMKWVSSIHSKNKNNLLFSSNVQEEMMRFVKIGKTTSRWMAFVTTRDKMYWRKE